MAEVTPGLLLASLRSSKLFCCPWESQKNVTVFITKGLLILISNLNQERRFNREVVSFITSQFIKYRGVHISGRMALKINIGIFYEKIQIKIRGI